MIFARQTRLDYRHRTQRMSESKPKSDEEQSPDYSGVEGIYLDEDGNPRPEMESLEKSGSSDQDEETDG